MKPAVTTPEYITGEDLMSRRPSTRRLYDLSSFCKAISFLAIACSISWSRVSEYRAEEYIANSIVLSS